MHWFSIQKLEELLQYSPKVLAAPWRHECKFLKWSDDCRYKVGSPQVQDNKGTVYHKLPGGSTKFQINFQVRLCILYLILRPILRRGNHAWNQGFKLGKTSYPGGITLLQESVDHWWHEQVRDYSPGSILTQTFVQVDLFGFTLHLSAIFTSKSFVMLIDKRLGCMSSVTI